MQYLKSNTVKNIQTLTYSVFDVSENNLEKMTFPFNALSLYIVYVCIVLHVSTNRVDYILD